MKKVLVDIYKIKDMYSGLGQFSLNFAKELLMHSKTNYAIDFLIPNGKKPNLGETNYNLVKANFFKQIIPQLNKEYSIWHSLQQFPLFKPNKKAIWILTIHDLNFLIEKNDVKKKKYLKKLQKNVNKADYITTISNYSRLQIEKNLNLKGKKVQVIYNGIDSFKNIPKEKPDFIVEKKFFFSIGIFNPKKNFASLIPVMKHFPDYHLIIAGNNQTTYGKEVQEKIDELNLSDRIILPGKINESNKQWLYENCEAFLFPSLAEGFGMPVVEAMKLGKAVFLSKLTSLPEIGGDVAFYYDNFEEKHMANLMKEKLDEVSKNEEKFSLRTKKYAEKFNWKTCVLEYLELYNKIVTK